MDLSDAQAELMSDLPSRKVPLVSPLKVDRKALPLYSTRWGVSALHLYARPSLDMSAYSLNWPPRVAYGAMYLATMLEADPCTI